MKVIEGRKYLDGKHFDIADYMKNFNRETQTEIIMLTRVN